MRRIAEGSLEPMGKFFTKDGVAHLTDHDMKGGHN